MEESMSAVKQSNWITGQEFGQERRKLLESGLDDESPEMQRLWSQVRERDESLWQQHGKTLLESHRSQWLAISPDGETVLRSTAGEAMWEAAKRFGEGNYCIRKLAEFPGLEIKA